MSSDVLIEMRGVTRNYQMGEVIVRALRGMDLTIDRGDFIVLLGPSGSGKTTTLNLLGGLDRPTGGSIVVDGQEVTNLNEKALTAYRRDEVGFIFQFFNLVPTLTARENVEFALALTGRNNLAGRADRLLELVDLGPRADHFPAQLSGGEQQRVAIARALANDPPLLLCDEPTGNLDVETGQRVLQTIRDLNERQGTTVVLVTHNVAIAPMARRVLRLRDGAIDGDELNNERAAVAELAW